MCLSRNKLKTFKDNDNVRIGYKIFDKEYNTYYNPFYLCSGKHYLGSWHENKLQIDLGYEIHRKSYKSGFHFYSSIPTNKAEVIVECICENITATGEQNFRGAFVAQSYRLMREV